MAPAEITDIMRRIPFLQILCIGQPALYMKSSFAPRTVSLLTRKSPAYAWKTNTGKK